MAAKKRRHHHKKVTSTTAAPKKVHHHRKKAHKRTIRSTPLASVTVELNSIIKNLENVKNRIVRSEEQ